MTHHHTKDKGDLGIAEAHASLVRQGFMVLFPATEHAPFDLVAYRDGRFLRVQVKYRRVYRGGVTVAFASVWSDRQGVHKREMDKSEVDVVCIYCPETDECYYVDPARHGRSVSLRVEPPASNQRRGVLFARDFREVLSACPQGTLFSGP